LNSATTAAPGSGFVLFAGCSRNQASGTKGAPIADAGATVTIVSDD
jgi:hypothetical protein